MQQDCEAVAAEVDFAANIADHSSKYGQVADTADQGLAKCAQDLQAGVAHVEHQGQQSLVHLSQIASALPSQVCVHNHCEEDQMITVAHRCTPGLMTRPHM